MAASHPTRPVLGACMNDRSGAFSPIRRVLSRRLQSAESGQLKVAADDASCGAPARPVAGSSLNYALRSR